MATAPRLRGRGGAGVVSVAAKQTLSCPVLHRLQVAIEHRLDCITLGTGAFLKQTYLCKHKVDGRNPFRTLQGTLVADDSQVNTNQQLLFHHALLSFVFYRQCVYIYIYIKKGKTNKVTGHVSCVAPFIWVASFFQNPAVSGSGAPAPCPWTAWTAPRPGPGALRVAGWVDIQVVRAP